MAYPNGQTALLLPLGPNALSELAQVLDQAGLPGADLNGPKKWFFRFVDAGAAIGFGGLKAIHLTSCCAPSSSIRTIAIAGTAATSFAL